MCETNRSSNDQRYFIREMELENHNIKIYQEWLSDVGGVVWDSAIVACHYFVRKKDYWKRKQVIELGAGTGVCSITLAMLGAYVMATDLPERLSLIRLNVNVNEKVIKAGEGSIRVDALDWNQKVPSMLSFDVVLLIDSIYYLKGVESLMRTLLALRFGELLCIYEKRDIGEAYLAQKRFLKLASPYFDIIYVSQSELDPVFSDASISVLRLIRKNVVDSEFIHTL